MENKIQYADVAPYPPVKVCGQNQMYARCMLNNIGSCNSEMSAISLYLYNIVISKEKFPEVSKCFHGINLVEMHHLSIFSQLAKMLGADPRLWSYCGTHPVYWSPNCNEYSCELSTMLKNAISAENKAIDIYRRQCNQIADECIVENLKRIITDEECHVVIFKQLYKDLCS